MEKKGRVPACVSLGFVCMIEQELRAERGAKLGVLIFEQLCYFGGEILIYQL